MNKYFDSKTELKDWIYDYEMNIDGKEYLLIHHETMTSCVIRAFYKGELMFSVDVYQDDINNPILKFEWYGMEENNKIKEIMTNYAKGE